MPAELKDLVQFAIDKQPSKFKDAFEELLAQRVVNNVDELKAEIQANMFGESPEDDEDDMEDLDSDDDVDYEDEDVDDIVDISDDELEDLINFDDEDEDLDDEDGVDFDEDEDSFNEELVDAIKEDTKSTHRLDSQETRPAKGGGITIGVRGGGNNILDMYTSLNTYWKKGLITFQSS